MDKPLSNDNYMIKRFYVVSDGITSGYDSIVNIRLIPNPHSSGCWEDGFEFNNEHFILLVVI